MSRRWSEGGTGIRNGDFLESLVRIDLSNNGILQTLVRGMGADGLRRHVGFGEHLHHL